MTIAPLRDALSTLHRAFHEPGLINARDDLKIELPSYEAGERFEAWLLYSAPPSMFPINNWGSEYKIDGVRYREIIVDGVHICWPVQLNSPSDRR